MAFTTIAKVRLFTNLTTADITDADITSFLIHAAAQMSADINVRVKRERVSQIDNTRKNEINGTNTTFYVQNWKKYLSDYNNDGSVDTDDVIVYQVASDGTETTLTVSSIDHDDGKFVLSSAPISSVTLYVSYAWCDRDVATPSTIVQTAATYLVAAYAFEKINRGLSPSQSFGNVRLMRDMQAGNEFYKRYLAEINKITSSSQINFTESKEIF